MRFIKLLTCFLAVTFLTAGCMTTSGWNDGNVRQINQGDTQQEIAAVFGEPTTQAMSSDGTMTWMYRKPADSDGFSKNNFFALYTIGQRTGSNAMVVDVLKIVFRDGRVVSHSYVENLDNNLGNAGQ